MIVKSVDHDDAKKCQLWHLVVIRSGGELELLTQSYDSREAAEYEARRLFSWIQMAQVAIVPSSVDFQRMQLTVDPKKAPMPLETAGK